MAATVPILSPGVRVTGTDGLPLSGAHIYSYTAGTTTPKALYSDADLTVSLGADIVCDSSGYPTSNGTTRTLLYADPATDTKLIFKSSAGVTVLTHDLIPGGTSAAEVAALIDYAKSIEPTVALTSATTLGSAHYGRLILANPTGGSFALTLPSAAVAGDGKRTRIRHSGTAGTVSVVSSGTDQIAGPSSTGASYQLTAANQEVELVSTGAGWIASALYNAPGSVTVDMLSSSISGSFWKVGQIGLFAVETPPAGYLECDGTAKSRSTYSELFAKWGTTFGAGDGSTTFNLIDLRGRVLRGWDHGAGADPDAASRSNRGDGTTGDRVGTKQADAMQSHTHGLGTIAASTTVTLANNTSVARSPSTFTAGSGGTQAVVSGISTATVTATGSTTLTGDTGTPTGATATETRMKNISLMFCVFADPAAATGASAPLNTILSGTGAPINAIGVNGDFYLATDSTLLYGPKASNSWTGVPTIRLTLNPLGPWVTSTAYNKRDLTTSGGYLYLCISDHTSGASTQPGVGASWQTVWAVISAAGTGDVTGPASATDNAITRFDSTTGKLVQTSAAQIDDTGSLVLPNGATVKINGADRLSESALTLAIGGSVSIGGTMVTNGVQTGWADPVGTTSRASINTGTATVGQVAQALGQLILDLKAGKFPRT